jgi:HD-GYP domain-containing protein (c-di-GMP phosphodiesterase class II)
MVEGFLGGGFLSAVAVIMALTRSLRNHTKELEKLKAEVLEQHRDFEEKVADRTKALEEANQRLKNTSLEIFRALTQAMHAKDTALSGHSHNVALYAKAIAEELILSREWVGMSEGWVERMIRGCELHDLGKIAIPDAILQKPSSLSPEEFEIIKQHPRWGAQILKPLTFMKEISEMVHQEHERWDGTGYPQSLKRDQIRVEARIIAVADALDAMTSDRPYRRKRTLAEAAEELKRCAGTQFDPQVVEGCLRTIENGKLSIASPHLHAAEMGTGSQRTGF